MKRKKEIARLEVDRHKIKPIEEHERDERHAFSLALRDVVIDNLESISSGDAHDIRQTWEYISGRRFSFDLEFGLAIEVEHPIEEQRTKHGTLKVCFNLTLVDGCDIPTIIGFLDDEIRRLKKGLHELRKLQLARVLQTDGPEAFTAAQERG